MQPYSTVQHLIDAIIAAGGPYVSDDLEELGRRLGTFPAYVKAVSDMDFVIMSRRGTGADIEDVDRSRTALHNAAIAACSYINRELAAYHLPQVCPDEEADRVDVGNFAMAMTAAMFMNRYRDEHGKGTADDIRGLLASL